ncbi:dynein light chain Tctex-type 5-A [Ctenopharyngodon idella]|uniref:dynein light chain Tctex-type 5-A n=1 Tax=Ctenopharyngodon idella TaxID=7959 RepID=UPI00222E4431|nr:dynein light chain Tctex-type 5-A [Ctenopharyngodon idella]
MSICYRNNMQKEEKQWKGLQEKSKSTLRRKTSKENPQSSLIPIQRRRSSTWTMKKEPRDQKLPSDRDEQLIHYQTIPERRFSTDRAREIIKRIVDERLETVEYSGTCAVISKELSDCIKTAVKKLLYERYKLVCFVAIGQLKDSVVNCSSRAVWSPTADTFTEYIYKNRSLFAVCLLFAVYKE